jgi:hypothetical protein
LSDFRRLLVSAVGVIAIFGIAQALAQAQRPPQPPQPAQPRDPGRTVPPTVQHRGENFSAGKTPQQLFASDCSGCHRAAQGLAKNKGANSLGEFMREHYTNSRESAYALASYLNSVRNAAAPPRVPPTQAPGAPTAPGAPGATERPTTASVPRPPGTIPGEGEPTPPAGEPPKPTAEQPPRQPPPPPAATKRGARGQAAAKQLLVAPPEPPPPPPPPKVEVPEIFD